MNQIIRRLLILTIWGVAAINYISAWNDHVSHTNGEMVIDDKLPFILITVIAITATIGVLWLFSKKQLPLNGPESH
jgi:hypothetical protein